MENSDYQTILNFLLKTLTAPSLNSDRDINRDNKLKENIISRESDVTNLLHEFVENHKVKNADDKKLKNKVLIGICVALILVSCIIIVAFICILALDIDIASIVALLGVVISFITAISFIIKILLKYLFPLDADKNIINLLSKIIEHDFLQYKHLRSLNDNKDKTKSE